MKKVKEKGRSKLKKSKSKNLPQKKIKKKNKPKKYIIMGLIKILEYINILMHFYDNID